MQYNSFISIFVITFILFYVYKYIVDVSKLTYRLDIFPEFIKAEQIVNVDS